MYLSRFEALSLLPKSGLCTVYLVKVTKSGDVMTDRRRVTSEVLVDRFLTDTPAYELAELGFVPELGRARSLGLAIWVGAMIYLKPSPQRVKRFLRKIGRPDPPHESWTYVEKEIRAEVLGRK